MTVRTAPTHELGAERLRSVRALLDAAFDGEFSEDDWDHALGGQVMAALERVADGTHAFAALSASDDGAALCRARGRRVWEGRIEVLGPEGVVRLADEEGSTRLRPAAGGALPDAAAPLIFDWRDGDVL
ncbi:hypothetical protein ACH4M4_15495 [Streptomyces sp. NPDC017254]|uniref:hypothetical protein n=1 Tax=unclassified Streptomyces TaxID=2593676 RepID=UPI00379F958B